MYTVYVLIDPRDHSTQYIGITKDVYQRMRQHSRCEGNNTAKNAWIVALQKEQVMFIMHSLEKVETFGQALDRETYWIRHYLGQGIPLLNSAGIVPVPARRQPDKPRHRPIPAGFVRYNSDRFLSKLYFRGTDEILINFTKATARQFAEYLDGYIAHDWSSEDLDSKLSRWNISGWRCKVLNDLRLNGMQLEIYNCRGERVTDLIGNPLDLQIPIRQ